MGILVSGGAGYIGSHVVLELLENDEDVIILDDFSVGRQMAVPEGVTKYMGDIADTRLVQRLIDAHDITSVMHMAAYTSILGSVSDPKLAYGTNTAKSSLFLKAVVEAGVKQFIYSSSGAVYGLSSKAVESAELAPVSPYGRSQAMFEQIIHDIANASGISYAILRCFNVAGADQKLRIGQWSEKSHHLVKIASEAAVGIRDKVTIYGNDYDTPDGTCIRDYTHVTDMAKGHVAALRWIRASNKNAIINLGSGKGYSVSEIIETAKKISGRDFQVAFEARREGDVDKLISENSLASKIIRWQPELSLDVIVETAINWEARLLEIANSQT